MLTLDVAVAMAQSDNRPQRPESLSDVDEYPLALAIRPNFLLSATDVAILSRGNFSPTNKVTAIWPIQLLATARRAVLG